MSHPGCPVAARRGHPERASGRPRLHDAMDRMHGSMNGRHGHERHRSRRIADALLPGGPRRGRQPPSGCPITSASRRHRPRKLLDRLAASGHIERLPASTRSPCADRDPDRCVAQPFFRHFGERLRLMRASRTATATTSWRRASRFLGELQRTRGRAQRRGPPKRRRLKRDAPDVRVFFSLRGQDLNLRPLGYEPSELPSCSTPRHKNQA